MNNFLYLYFLIIPLVISSQNKDLINTSNNIGLENWRIVNDDVMGGISTSELYLNNETGSSIIKYDYASIPNIKTSQWIKELFDTKENIMVECKINKRFNKWMPVKECNSIDCITMLS